MQKKHERIVRVAGIIGGRMVIKGSRLPVGLILERLACDLDFTALFADYPDLTGGDVKACIAYAKGLVEDEERRGEAAEDKMLGEKRGVVLNQVGEGLPVC